MGEVKIIIVVVRHGVDVKSSNGIGAQSFNAT
jgi:hypothetical protein